MGCYCFQTSSKAKNADVSVGVPQIDNIKKATPPAEKENLKEKKVEYKNIEIKGNFISEFNNYFKSLKNDINKQNNDIDKINRIIEEDFTNFFQIEKILGINALGLTYLVRSISDKELYVMRSVCIENIDESNLNDFRNQINLLMTIDNPQICKCLRLFSDQKYYYLIFNYMKGSNLIDHLSKNNDIVNEENSKNILFSLLSSVNELHSKNNLFFDVSLENIILKDNNIKHPVLIDFGFSFKFKKKVELKESNKLYFHFPPEIFSGSYDSQSDVWSLGVVLYILLSGEPPFFSDNYDELVNEICEKEVSFEEHNPIWETISDSAKDLLKSMLRKDPSSRPSAIDCLDHSFFKNSISKNPKGNKSKINMFNFRKLNFENNFNLRLVEITLSNLETSDIKKFEKELNSQIQNNKKGLIKISLLHKIILDFKNNSLSDELKTLVQEYNLLETNINLTSILGIFSKIKNSVIKELVWRIYQYFDLEKNEKVIKTSLLNNEILANGMFTSEQIASCSSVINFDSFLEIYKKYIEKSDDKKQR